MKLSLRPPETYALIVLLRDELLFPDDDVCECERRKRDLLRDIHLKLVKEYTGAGFSLPYDGIHSDFPGGLR